MSVVSVGDKVHVITRRIFEAEVRRHFAGEVIAVEGALCRIEGYTFVFTQGVNEYRRRPELRTRIFSLGQEGFIVNVLPTDVVVADLSYRTTDGRLVITDGANFSLDINEFGNTR